MAWKMKVRFMDIATKQCTDMLHAPYKGTIYHVHLTGSQSTLFTQQHSYVFQIGRHTKGKVIS
jgi:hypothetical protein